MTTNTMNANVINFRFESMAKEFADSLSFFMEKVENKEDLTYGTYYVKDADVFFL